MDIKKTQSSMPVIDVHRHCMARPLSSEFRAIPETVLRMFGLRKSGAYFSIRIKGITSIAYEELMDIDLQIKGQEEAGVTRGLLSFSMSLEGLCRALHLPPLKVARRLNDSTAAMVKRYPDRLGFMAMVNPFEKSAIDECKRCLHELGASGISISTSWKGNFLDSPRIDPFWEYAQENDLAVFLHPPFVPIGYQKMSAYKLEEIVGRPFDTAMTVARMIYSGVFDRYPGLKIVLPHMGGGLPCVVGRLDFGYRLGYEGLPRGQHATCMRMPGDYLRTNLYVDTMGFSPSGIRQSIELFGADRVLFGTDYAAVPISPKEHIDIVKGLGLSPEDKENILWRNAKRLFKLV